VPHSRTVTIADHRVIHVSCSSEHEAYFVCGALNSTFARLLAGYFIIETQIAPHILNSIRIPKYDSTVSLHKLLVAEAKRLSSGAADATDPVNSQIDILCKDLWGITEQELKSVVATYRDLYVSIPKAQPESKTEAELG